MRSASEHSAKKKIEGSAVAIAPPGARQKAQRPVSEHRTNESITSE